MTANELKQLEKDLWEAADQLRANSKLTATEYNFPVLGLIFLRHAFSRFKDAKEKIEKELPVHPQRGRRAITKDDFLQAKAIFLPEQSRWDYIASLPEAKDIGEELDEAMRSIEREYDVLDGVLPKNYYLFEKDLLQRLVRIFNKEALDTISGDVFGRIYEYFLNEFAKSGAQEGGEFFTPPSLVNTIVAIIEPANGVVFDPACGSAGMFVQTGHFLEDRGEDPTSKVTFFGQEKTDTNTKLAKMNIAVHGLEASILQGNSFYEDHHALVGKCDFVMANPPFNVDGVDKSKDSVKQDRRLPFGLPKNDNANYLWIQYFYAYLNSKGRAGFVMASSASDAGHSEKDIRKELVETGAVDVMVSIGTKFFYTRSLPCTLWFFDRAKENDPERKDKTLMLDLRDVYRKVSSNLHDFTPEHLKNIKSIVGLYRGNAAYFHQTLNEYRTNVREVLNSLNDILAELHKKAKLNDELIMSLTDVGQTIALDELKKQKRFITQSFKSFEQTVKEKLREETIRKDKVLKEKLTNGLNQIEELVFQFQELADTGLYFHKEELWLLSRFPIGEYTDVSGLCKIVTKKQIAESDYSLTAGRYVGVESQIIDEDFDFETRMREIKLELLDLNKESEILAKTIEDKFQELGI